MLLILFPRLPLILLFSPALLSEVSTSCATFSKSHEHNYNSGNDKRRKPFGVSVDGFLKESNRLPLTLWVLCSPFARCMHVFAAFTIDGFLFCAYSVPSFAAYFVDGFLKENRPFAAYFVGIVFPICLIPSRLGASSVPVCRFFFFTVCLIPSPLGASVFSLFASFHPHLALLLFPFGFFCSRLQLRLPLLLAPVCRFRLPLLSLDTLMMFGSYVILECILLGARPYYELVT